MIFVVVGWDWLKPRQLLIICAWILDNWKKSTRWMDGWNEWTLMCLNMWCWLWLHVDYAGANLCTRKQRQAFCSFIMPAQKTNLMPRLASDYHIDHYHEQHPNYDKVTSDLSSWSFNDNNNAIMSPISIQYSLLTANVDGDRDLKSRSTANEINNNNHKLNPSSVNTNHNSSQPSSSISNRTVRSLPFVSTKILYRNSPSTLSSTIVFNTVSNMIKCLAQTFNSTLKCSSLPSFPFLILVTLLIPLIQSSSAKQGQLFRYPLPQFFSFDCALFHPSFNLPMLQFWTNKKWQKRNHNEINIVSIKYWDMFHYVSLIISGYLMYYLNMFLFIGL